MILDLLKKIKCEVKEDIDEIESRQDFIDSIVKDYAKITQSDLQGMIEARCMCTGEDEDELYNEIMTIVDNKRLNEEAQINIDDLTWQDILTNDKISYDEFDAFMFKNLKLDRIFSSLAFLNYEDELTITGELLYAKTLYDPAEYEELEVSCEYEPDEELLEEFLMTYLWENLFKIFNKQTVKTIEDAQHVIDTLDLKPIIDAAKDEFRDYAEEQAQEDYNKEHDRFHHLF